MMTKCQCFLLMILAVAAGAAQAQPPTPGNRIYVCGHSFHVVIAQPLEEIGQLARLKGHAVVGRSFLGGSTVSRHWNVPDGQSEVKQAIRAGKVDVLTLSPHPRMLPDEGITKFTDLLLAANPNGIVVVQESWLGFDDQGRGAFRNDDRDKTDLKDLRKASEAAAHPLRKQLQELSKEHREKHGRQVVYLVPVGEAVLQLREQVAQGKVPGITKQSQLFRDDPGHPTAPVAVLAAYCHDAVIYQRSPVGLGVPDSLAKAGLGRESGPLNRFLQELAWKVVTSEPLSGVPVPKNK